MTLSTTVHAREHCVWVTAFGGAVDHAVRQIDLAAGAHDTTRGIRALCGERFMSAPMIAEPGMPCFRCRRHLQVRATMQRNPAAGNTA